MFEPETGTDVLTTKKNSVRKKTEGCWQQRAARLHKPEEEKRETRHIVTHEELHTSQLCRGGSEDQVYMQRLITDRTG